MSFSSDGNTLVMSSFGSNAHKEQKAPFWKKNSKNVPGSIRPVYGAQHPPIHEMPSSAHSTPKREGRRGRDSFADFQEKTNDAWDDGDDELIVMANFKMSLKDVRSTAIQVLSDHSNQNKIRNDRLSTSSGDAETNGSDDGSLDKASGDGTPKRTRSSSPGGPGLGVRMNTTWNPPRLSAIQRGHLPIPDRESSKADKFKAMVSAPVIDIEELRKLSWSGISKKYRPIAWKLLSGYLPPIEDRRQLTLERKRKEYFNFVEQYYHTRHEEPHKDTFRQISIDIPRMSPLIPIFQQPVVQQVFERILYIWAIRHPASGYVQGINDLVTPFFVVFLSEYIANDLEIENCDVSTLPEQELQVVEADSFWCFSKLLDGIQDNYTFAQPGIQIKVKALKDIISRVDSKLHKHLETHHVEYLQFAFRWMNNLLMREIPLHCTIRLWDSYLAEINDFASLHLYVCAALLLRFASDALREPDFQGIMLLLQKLPTENWSNDEVSLLLAEAYRLKYTFADAPNHLAPKK